jgi:WXXGXW repeat (2 copies)
MSRRVLMSTVAAALLSAGVLTGCVVTPVGPDAYVTGTVAIAPPAAPVEYYGVAPAPGFIWAAGYWNWVGGRHVWVAGHWMRGRPGYRWVPHRWVRAGGGWRLAPGHWAR